MSVPLPTASLSLSPPLGRPSFCKLSAERGHYESDELRWFYNKTTGACETFIYAGMRGNRNRFSSKRACQRKCRANQRYCSPHISAMYSKYGFYDDQHLTILVTFASEYVEVYSTHCHSNGLLLRTKCVCILMKCSAQDLRLVM